MCSISLHGSFEHPGSLANHPVEVKGKKKNPAINNQADRTVRVQRRRDTPLETQVYTPPKATSCQSTQSDNHSILCIPSDSETGVLATLHQWTREVQMVLKPFAASYKQEPALAIQRQYTTHFHSLVACGELPGTP